MSHGNTGGRVSGRCRLAVPAFVVFGALVASGCASFAPRPLPRETADGMPYQTTDPGGIIFGVRLPESAEDVQRQFGRDLLGINILPVQVGLLLRKNCTKDFVVDPRSCMLEYEDGTSLTHIDYKLVKERAYFSQWRSLPAWLFLLPGFFSSSSISAANEKMLQTYREMELVERITLRNNTSKATEEGHNGVLFFTSDKPIDLPRLRQGGWIQLTATIEEGGSIPQELKIIF
ncbi:MAG: hypothetical protein ACKVX7_12880 [Planctomycetota bacterium]